jgi:hypothetical protein
MIVTPVLSFEGWVLELACLVHFDRVDLAFLSYDEFTLIGVFLFMSKFFSFGVSFGCGISFPWRIGILLFNVFLFWRVLNS